MNNKLQHWASIELGYFTGSKDSTRFIHIYVLFSFAPLLYFSFGKLVFRWNPSSSTDLNVEGRGYASIVIGDFVAVAGISLLFVEFVVDIFLLHPSTESSKCTWTRYCALEHFLCYFVCVHVYNIIPCIIPYIYKGGLKCTCENLRFYSKLISILPRNNLWVCPSFFIRETIYFIPWIISYTYEEVKLRLYIVNIRDTRNYIKITNIFIDKINISSRSFEKYLGKRFISFAI